MYRALIMSPMRIKNSSVAGAHNKKKAPPSCQVESQNFLAERTNRTSIAMPAAAKAATHIGYTRAGHGAYMAARARNITTGETRFPTAIHGKTVTPPTKVSVARTFIRIEPCDAKY